MRRPKNLPLWKVCDADNGDNTASETTYSYEKVGVSVQKRAKKGTNSGTHKKIFIKKKNAYGTDMQT